MRNSLKKMIIATIILASSFGCKKISAPNEESKKIFGSWSYDSNFGGNAGTGESKRFKNDTWVEFTEKGYFKVYLGSKKQSQKQFKIKMVETIYDASHRPAIYYVNGDFETYQISHDTLYLSDEIYDGYTYRFIKK